MWSWGNVWLSSYLAVKTEVTREWLINLHGFEVTDLSIIGVTYFTSSPLRFHVDSGGGITISDVLQFWEGDRSHDHIKISYQLLLVKLSSFLKYSLTLKYKCSENSDIVTDLCLSNSVYSVNQASKEKILARWEMPILLRWKKSMKSWRLARNWRFRRRVTSTHSTFVFKR